jgi:hypothetical protein
MAQVRMDDSARLCQDNIRQRAIDQFGTRNIRFDQINTNRNGWVSGMLRVGGGPGATEYRFSCSVNLDTGYVRSARIENQVAGAGRPGYGEAGRDVVAAGMDQCRAAIADRIRGQGFWNVRISDMNRNVDGDRVSGFARADGQDHPQSFGFSCSLDRDTGRVQGTSVTRR